MPTQKNVARLVDSENLSKTFFFSKKFKKQYAHTKSVARLFDSENFSDFFFLQKNYKTRTQKKRC